MKKEDQTKTKLQTYLNLNKGLLLNKKSATVMSRTLTAAALPIVFIANPFSAAAQGGCGTANGVNVTPLANNQQGVDVDGDGNNDIIIYPYGGYQVFLQVNNGFSIAFNGVRNGGYPIADQFAAGVALPGALGFSPGLGGYLTFIDNSLAGNVMPWQEGESGYIAIKQGSNYGFIHLTIGAANTKTVAVDISQTGFSDGTSNVIVGDCASLPVELVSLFANASAKAVALTWQTATETDNAGFEIQRSTDGANFESLTFIEGNGTTEATQVYTYEDESLRSGQLYYYRLKQIDFDGAFAYSPIVTARTTGNDIVSTFVPNPAVAGQTVLNYTTGEAGEMELRIFDVSGKALQEKSYMATEGSNRFAVDLSALDSGMYFVKMKQGEQTTYEKIVVK